MLNPCVDVHHRLAQQLVFLLTKDILSQQQTLCGTVSASLADWLLGSRPVGVRQAPYVPSTNLEEWVTQKCVSEPSQVNLLCTNLVFNRGKHSIRLQAECGGNETFCSALHSVSCSTDALALTS